MTRTRIGLLGASGIAPRALIAPSRRRDDVTLAAVASRSDASEYAQRHGIDHVYASYQALIEDTEIDLVYIAVPPSEHARWSIAAVEAGKDVLCEKPLAVNAAEANEVAAAATRCGHRVIEAFHDHYQPAFVERSAHAVRRNTTLVGIRPRELDDRLRISLRSCGRS